MLNFFSFCTKFAPSSTNHINLSSRKIWLSASFNASCSKKRRVKGPPWRILFFGTDAFSLESLRPLCAKLRTGTIMSSLGVVSRRGSLVQKFAEEEKLKYYDWPVKTFPEEDYDLGMVVSFGNLIPEKLIDWLPLGCLNVHASLLPRWRGAAPIAHALMNGDTETGVTIMKIKPFKFDIGDIVRQYRVPIAWNETSVDLERKLASLGSQLLMECLRDLPRSVQMTIPQPNEGATYAPKVTAHMASVKWQEMSAGKVFNLYRGLKSFFVLNCLWEGRPIKLVDIEPDTESKTSRQDSKQTSSQKTSALSFLLDENTGTASSESTHHTPCVEAGHLIYNKKSKTLKVICADSEIIVVKKLCFKGKTMKGCDFYNGFLSKLDRSKWRFTS